MAAPQCVRTQGWFWSEGNESCDMECGRHNGLTCNSKSVRQMATIKTGSAFHAANSQDIWPGTDMATANGCASYGTDPAAITPFFIVPPSTGHTYQCEWRRQNDDVTCKANGEDQQNSYAYARLCYCADEAEVETEGWFWSETNESCDQECAKHPGLTCNAESINQMKTINNAAAFHAANSPSIWPGTEMAKANGCSSYGDDPWAGTPFFIVGGSPSASWQCEWRRENDNVTCDASGASQNNGYGYQRLCYCAAE